MLIAFRMSFSGGRNFTKSASNFVSRNVGNSFVVCLTVKVHIMKELKFSQYEKNLDSLYLDVFHC